MKDTCTERARNSSHKDGFPWVKRLRSIHHKVAVIQVPWADLDLSHTKPTSGFWGFFSSSLLSFTELSGNLTKLVCVCVPTDRLVFDGGAGHAEVQLAILLDAGIDQSLH